MAASIAALYPNSDASSSAKKRGYTLDEIKTIVAHSGAPPTVVAVTLAALSARGEWPREDGPATTILSVALKGIMFDSVPSCCRRTAQRRIKRALKDEYWRSARDAHSWTDCPKCGKQRNAGKCQGCGYRGRSKDASGNWTGEFMRVPTYEFDIEKFRRAPRCKELRHFDARTYAEYKEAAERGEHPNVREFPSPPRNDPPPPKPPAPAVPQPTRKVAEHRSNQQYARKLTSREGPKLVNEMRRLMQGVKGQLGVDRLWIEYAPNDPRYRAPMSQENALIAACMNLAIPESAAREFLKLLPRRDLGEGEQEQSH
jgi:hypothetical protein